MSGSCVFFSGLENTVHRTAFPNTLIRVILPVRSALSSSAYKIVMVCIEIFGTC